MFVTDLWSTPTPKVKETPQPQKSNVATVNESKKKPPVTLSTTPAAPISEETKYIINAGTNRYDRQLYLIGYEDCKEWSISAVPYITNYKTAQQLVSRATKELAENKVKVFGRTRELPEFKIQTIQEARLN